MKTQIDQLSTPKIKASKKGKRKKVTTRSVERRRKREGERGKERDVPAVTVVAAL